MPREMTDPTLEVRDEPVDKYGEIGFVAARDWETHFGPGLAQPIGRKAAG